MVRHVWAARPFRLLLGIAGAVVLAALLSACHGGPHLALTVTTDVDGHDANPGDGLCEINAGAGDCSLRAAVDEVNATVNVEATINLPAGFYVLTLPGNDNNNFGGDLDFLAGKTTLVIPRAGASIGANGGDAAIDVRGGTLNATNLAALDGTSAGIVVRGGAHLNLTNSTAHRNTGPGLRVDAGGTASLFNSTLGANLAPGLSAAGTVVASSSTIAGNFTGITGGGAVTLRQSIVGRQGVGPNCTAPVASANWNLDSDGTCGLTQPDDLSNVGDTQLDFFYPNNVPAFRPRSTSPAVDSLPVAAGLCGSGVYAADQRHVARPLGPACDRGAVEREVPISLVVDTPTDANDAYAGDGVCDINAPPANPGDCSLRAAITETFGWITPDTITIAPGTNPVLTLDGFDDSNANGDLDVGGDLTIHGNGNTVTGLADEHVISILHSTITIEDLTVTGGLRGIYMQSGDLNLSDVTITGNTNLVDCPPSGFARQSRVVLCTLAAVGAGLVQQAGTLTLTRSTISDNTARRVFTCPICGSAEGAGLYQAGGVATITDSTISGNRAIAAGGTPRGGGILQTGGSLSLIDSTVSNNVVQLATPAGEGGGLWVGASAVITRSTIADNQAGIGLAATFGPSTTVTLGGTIVQAAGSSCSGTLPTSLGHNLASDSSCGLGATGDLQGVNPLLGPLVNNGGPTKTHLPGVGSPAINAIPFGTASFCDAATPPDQRGVARPQNTDCDKGSVEQ
jgi:hypothetical protein